MESYEYVIYVEVIVSCERFTELVSNSYNPDPNKRIEESFDILEDMEQGVITFVIITLDEMFVMSNYAI